MKLAHFSRGDKVGADDHLDVFPQRGDELLSLALRLAVGHKPSGHLRFTSGQMTVGLAEAPDRCVKVLSLDSVGPVYAAVRLYAAVKQGEIGIPAVRHGPVEEAVPLGAACIRQRETRLSVKTRDRIGVRGAPLTFDSRIILNQSKIALCMASREKTSFFV